MSEAWTDLAAAEAYATKQAALEWKRLGRVLRRRGWVRFNVPIRQARASFKVPLTLESVCNALGLHVDDEAARIRVAEKIFKLAGHGMRGATLHATAVKEFEADRSNGNHV